jgi:hypothetical protein
MFKTIQSLVFIFFSYGSTNSLIQNMWKIRAFQISQTCNRAGHHSFFSVRNHNFATSYPQLFKEIVLCKRTSATAIVFSSSHRVDSYNRFASFLRKNSRLSRESLFRVELNFSDYRHSLFTLDLGRLSPLRSSTPLQSYVPSTAHCPLYGLLSPQHCWKRTRELCKPMNFTHL